VVIIKPPISSLQAVTTVCSRQCQLASICK